MTMLAIIARHGDARTRTAVGRGKIDGIMLMATLMKKNGARHDRFLEGEFDAAEISFAIYLRMWSQGKMDLSAIPGFLNRQFRHGAIFGVLSWFNTAALWAQRALEHQYGASCAR